MTYISSGRGRRPAFTLTELLVVVLIIAILVSLTTAGVMKIIQKGPEVQTAADLGQFGVAMQTFQTQYDTVTYFPSRLLLREDGQWNPNNSALERDSINFLQRMFGKSLNLAGPIDWNGDGKITPSVGGNNTPFILEGQHCLVFFLGGIPTAPGTGDACLGFSTSQTNPATPGGTRRGPFFDFKPARLFRETSGTAVGFFRYGDGWSNTTRNQPYAYFSAYGKNNGYNPYGSTDCPSLNVQPYYESTTPTVRYTNPNTFQIISSGNDGVFGPGGLWSPQAGVTSGAGRDDLANFQRGVLGSGGS